MGNSTPQIEPDLWFGTLPARHHMLGSARPDSRERPFFFFTVQVQIKSSVLLPFL